MNSEGGKSSDSHIRINVDCLNSLQNSGLKVLVRENLYKTDFNSGKLTKRSVVCKKSFKGDELDNWLKDKMEKHAQREVSVYDDCLDMSRYVGKVVNMVHVDLPKSKNLFLNRISTLFSVKSFSKRVRDGRIDDCRVYIATRALMNIELDHYVYDYLNRT